MRRWLRGIKYTGSSRSSVGEWGRKVLLGLFLFVVFWARKVAMVVCGSVRLGNFGSSFCFVVSDGQLSLRKGCVSRHDHNCLWLGCRSFTSDLKA